MKWSITALLTFSGGQSTLAQLVSECAGSTNIILSDGESSFAAAESACEAQGAVLAKILTQREFEVAVELAVENAINDPYIGLNAPNPSGELGAFSFSDNAPLSGFLNSLDNWVNSQVNVVDDLSTACVKIDVSGNLVFDVDTCGETARFFCSASDSSECEGSSILDILSDFNFLIVIVSLTVLILGLFACLIHERNQRAVILKEATESFRNFGNRVSSAIFRTSFKPNQLNLSSDTEDLRKNLEKEPRKSCFSCFVCCCCCCSKEAKGNSNFDIVRLDPSVSQSALVGAVHPSGVTMPAPLDDYDSVGHRMSSQTGTTRSNRFTFKSIAFSGLFSSRNQVRQSDNTWVSNPLNTPGSPSPPSISNSLRQHANQPVPPFASPSSPVASQAIAPGSPRYEMNF